MSEGLAECFAECWLPDGSFHPGGKKLSALLLLRERPELPTLRSFLRQDEGEFIADSSHNYALAWAFTHFLYFGEGAERVLLDSLLARLAGGMDAAEAIDLAIAGPDFPAIAEAFQVWLGQELEGL